MAADREIALTRLRALGRGIILKLGHVLAAPPPPPHFHCRNSHLFEVPLHRYANNTNNTQPFFVFRLVMAIEWRESGQSRSWCCIHLDSPGSLSHNLGRASLPYRLRTYRAQFVPNARPRRIDSRWPNGHVWGCWLGTMSSMLSCSGTSPAVRDCHLSTYPLRVRDFNLTFGSVELSIRLTRTH